MYTREALLDVHERAHRSFRKLIAHAGGLGPGALDRELPGFGYPTIQLQVHHVIGCEEYWLGVIRGNFRAEDDAERYPTVNELERYRDEVARTTAAYLGAASAGELNTPREMMTWQGARRLLVPAHIILRTQTHLFQHQGQVLAMCRLLEHPAPPGFDFPLD